MDNDRVETAHEEWLRLMLDRESTDEQCAFARAEFKRVRAEQRNPVQKAQAKTPKS